MLTYLLHLLIDVLAPIATLMAWFTWALFYVAWRLGKVKVSYIGKSRPGARTVYKQGIERRL